MELLVSFFFSIAEIAGRRTRRARTRTWPPPTTRPPTHPHPPVKVPQRIWTSDRQRGATIRKGEIEKKNQIG
jgi:hypothetical protein